MTIREFFCGLDPLSETLNMGPLDRGHYVQIGLGTGFYIPESDYEQAQAAADETRKCQFVGVTKAGYGLHGTREEILENPESSGVIAWIFPKYGERV